MPSTWKASANLPAGSTSCRSAISKPRSRPSVLKRPASWSSRCRARAASTWRSNAWLKSLRELCDKHGLLLVLDEVQSGMGRTGKLFAHEWAGFTPDVMAVAKGLGGGFPIGAVLATKEAAKGMVAGTHGSTFGGNPLATAVGAAVLEAVLEPGFLEHVQAMSLRFKQQLAGLKDEYPHVIEEVRGSGLLTGIKVKPPYGDVVNACADEKLLTVGAGDNVVRLLPPLNVTEQELTEATRRLGQALARLPKPA